MSILSCGKVRTDSGHPAHLLHTEGTAVFAVSALEAGIRLRAQLGIVVGGDVIASQSQIVILVHEADVDACGAGLDRKSVV